MSASRRLCSLPSTSTEVSPRNPVAANQASATAGSLAEYTPNEPPAA